MSSVRSAEHTGLGSPEGQSINPRTISAMRDYTLTVHMLGFKDPQVFYGHSGIDPNDLLGRLQRVFGPLIMSWRLEKTGEALDPSFAEDHAALVAPETPRQ